MSRDEFKNLSAASRAMVDQATRKDIWEAAACDDLTALADTDPTAIADRFDHWLAVGETYFDGPAPLDGLIACLGRCRAQSGDGDFNTLDAIIGAYAEVVAKSIEVFEIDAHEDQLIALMDRDRFALQRIKARVLAVWRTNQHQPLGQIFDEVITAACDGLPRICSPGR